MPNHVTIRVGVCLLEVDRDEITYAVMLDGKPSFVVTIRDDEGEEWKNAHCE